MLNPADRLYEIALLRLAYAVDHDVAAASFDSERTSQQ